MNLLNRYLLKLFIRPFLASFSILVVLIFISQLFDRLDSFLADEVSITHVAGYLLTSMPLQIVNIMPVACLLGTLFVVGNLARTREYIAALAGGVPPEKFLGGILIAGFGLSIVTLLFNEMVVPPATLYAKTVYREKIRRLGQWEIIKYDNLTVAGADGRIWSARLFNQKKGVMERVVVDSYRENRPDFQIDAALATWHEDRWIFKKGTLRTYDPETLAIVSMESFGEREFEFSENPSDLVTQEPWPEEMNYKTLETRIDRLSSLGIPVRKLQVQLMMKLAFPFACFVVVCLGIPLAMKGMGSRAMGIAAGGALTLVYMGFIQFGEALAQRLIPPLAGAWLGNVVFMLIALFLWRRLRQSTY